MGVPNTETGSLKQQLNWATPDGAVMGKSATDLVAFYGSTPLPQRQLKEIIGQGTGGASIITSAFSTAGGTTTSAGFQNSAFTSLFGNWYTSSSSVSGASTSWYATGYAVSNASVMSAAATANIGVLGNLVGELCRTMVGLGVWNPL